MPLTVPGRAHIVPMGYEKERIYDAAETLRADEVVLITHTTRTEKNQEYYKIVGNELEERGIPHRHEECDIFDLYDSLGNIGELITAYQDHDVYVNISAGSKITAIAGMIACMVTEATPYYVQVEDYSGETPAHVVDIYELPEYPIKAPEPAQVNVLYFLEDIGEATKGEIIEFCEGIELEFMMNLDIQDKAKYRVLDRQIVNPLLRRDYIEVEKIGRNKVVKATEYGEQALRAFRYLVDDQIVNQPLDRYLNNPDD